MTKKLLHIDNLAAEINGHQILNGLSLTMNRGEVHAIMGPNGSGKSTLSYILAGKEDYDVTCGTVNFNDENILDLSAEERAHRGMFLAMQYPVEIPGVNNAYFLRAALNAVKKSRGEEEIDAADFLTLVRSHLAKLKMDEKFLHRSVNEGFSGGEKKRNEILQMSLLGPTLAILDETDSGLDIDALKICAEGINALRSEHRAMLVVTHYQRLLDYIEPDVVHVMVKGRIVKSGGKELAKQLEQEGYDAFLNMPLDNGAVA